MRYKRSHLIGLFAALLVLVTILGGGILLVIKEDHASAGSTEGTAYHFQGTDQPQAPEKRDHHGGAGWVHKRRKKHADEHAHAGRRAGKGYAVCDAGSHCPRPQAAGRHNGHAD